jgi:DnaJ-class molecular chaperone
VAAAQRHVELTTAHPCEVCGGAGKIQSSTPCPSCGGKGTVMCGVCDGRGYSLVPGTPPCTTCGGSGNMVQDGHRISCSACGGTGKGKGSVIKQSCTQCVSGRAPCRECVGGRITLLKECPECHGVGSRALADR